VVFEVFAGECFRAWKGSKAYLNDEEIRVSPVSRMEDTLTAVGLSHSSKETIDPLLRNIEFLLRETSGIRRIGSAAADLCYVACGRFDGFYQQNLAPWDVAAGALIVRQAGGKVTDFAGGDNYLYGKEIVAANALIFEEYRRAVV
jgi:myo-inositol-1(or 4)-monophosphatase